MPLINHSSLTHFDELLRKKIQVLDSQYFPQPWSDGSWEGVGEVSGEYFLSIGEKGGRVCAFALYRLNPYEGVAHLLKLLVTPEMRGNGMGYNLLSYGFTELDKLGYAKKYLEVADSNYSAIATYKKLGLFEVNRVKRFYSNGDTAIIMVSHK